MTNKLQGRLKRLHDSRIRADEHHRETRPDGVYDAEPHHSGSSQSPSLGKVTWEEAGFRGQPMVGLRTMAPESRHGRYRIAELSGHPLVFDVGDQAPVFQPEHIAMGYLDIETDGLADGATIFCVGLATWRGDALDVRQLALGDESGEKAMLQTLATWVAELQALVTFNGRSFDVPRLRTKFQEHGLPDPFRDATHLDLLVVLRRLFPGASATLSAVEVELLQFHRTDDVPGREAPERWREYKRTGDVGPLRAIFDHNYLDVVSLAAISHHVARCAGGLEAEVGPQPEGRPQVEGELTRQLRQVYRLKSRSVRREPVATQAPEPKARVKPSTFEGGRVASMRQKLQTLLATDAHEEAVPLLYEMMMLSPLHPYPVRELAKYYRSIGDATLAARFERRIEELEPF